MKNIAIGILMVVMLSVLVQPMVEIMEIGREKIIIGTALSNTCRASVLSLKQDQMRDLDAKIDPVAFADTFSEVFANAMNVTCKDEHANPLVFTSNDGKYNDFTVSVNLTDEVNASTEQTVTKVKVRAETVYKFKTNKLQEASDKVTPYTIVSERMQLLSVKN